MKVLKQQFTFTEDQVLSLIIRYIEIYMVNLYPRPISALYTTIHEHDWRRIDIGNNTVDACHLQHNFNGFVYYGLKSYFEESEILRHRISR